MPQHSAPSGRFGQTSEPPVFMRMGRRFPIEAQPEIPSHSEGEFRDTVSRWGGFRKACSALRAHSGMDFPHGAHLETVSRSADRFWDMLSARTALRKLCHTQRVQSGMQFPERRPWGNCVPFRRCGSPRTLSSAGSANKNRLEWEFQPVANARVCLTDCYCAPSRKKRRLK